MWTVVDDTPIRKGTNTFRLYRCDCGKELVVNSHSVKSGRSIGCRTCEGIRRRKSENYLAWAYLRNQYTSNASRLGRTWELTDEEFVKLTSSNCEYCGIKPSQVIKRKHATYIYNGIDRQDNHSGYTRENSVPCCKTCNYAKHKLEYHEWLSWLDRIGAKWGTNKSI